MRSVVFGTVLCYFALLNGQQVPFASRIIEYRPAPGQFINDPGSGTPAVAQGILNGSGAALSLGGYGGYIIFGFDHRIMNDPENPYGVDFTVFGNPVPNHAEQGIIRVMKDENRNGIPDDTWYEIAGSDHFTGGLKKEYSVTYYNPHSETACDVPWRDNSGNKGFIFKNNFHTQPYYPVNSTFPEINKDSLDFNGSLIRGRVEKSAGMFVSLPSLFGYADNTPENSGNNNTLPDNPYTTGIIEGSGGDAIDISWAVDPQGNYAELDGIDFIMIYTGVNANSVWLGEISTEIRSIADVSPAAAIKGPSSLVVPLNLPDKVSTSSVINIRSLFFESGRLVTGRKIEWISSDNSIAEVIKDSIISAYMAGEVKLFARLKDSQELLFEKLISVRTPVELRVGNIPDFIQGGQVISLDYHVIDNTGDKIEGINPEISLTGQDHMQVLNKVDGIISKSTDPWHCLC